MSSKYTLPIATYLLNLIGDNTFLSVTLPLLIKKNILLEGKLMPASTNVCRLNKQDP